MDKSSEDPVNAGALEDEELAASQDIAANRFVPTAGITSRLRSGVSWSLAGALINSGLNLVVSVVLARLLGTAGFGEFAITQSTMVAVAAVAQLATGYTANKFVAEYHSVDQDRTGRIIGFCAIISGMTAAVSLLIILVAAPWLATQMLDKPQLTSKLTIASGMVFFSVLNGYQMGVLAGLEAYKRMAKALGISATATFIIAVAGAWWAGLNGAVVGLSLGALAQWTVFYVALRAELVVQGIRVIYRGLGQVRSTVFHFAVPAAMGGFVTMPAIWLANSFLIRQTDGVQQMALFSATSTLRSLVLFLPLILNRVTMTLLNNQRGASDSGRYREVFRLNLFAAGAIALTCAIGVAAVGPWLLSAYGKDFRQSYPVLLILLAGGTLEVVYQAIYQLLQSNEKMWDAFLLIVIPRDISIVVLAFFLAPKWGGVGLASAYGISWLLSVFIVATLAWRHRLYRLST